ncbi:type II toxin-antitoxin system YafQ family toxin [Pasteurella atlantica]|uniref:type II toxin-antitoxin system RelE/ParE family toxin n=1 Tax=Pasteurellaceae TaxID=712 RepID=UPI002761F02F|nr:type II toxin-antitoxin system YafQ family toxin [Pasteurella atlantica]MDP8033791.1 type II toxin-antitoxin system YafQ family toxin [Pasteurella atlantica]MDP8035726.1 type II toxin-antitoxin system YafQ family toxin [Pasteurella atlantica]MDP8037738.1 type II toxin-antitoxin system YafQ family toxin [Pasteurella atlantica]MDP8048026.1 type II toxin-antitoxin system YafQ family toxin [Pasteurella atlantica]MDP8050050.1 type II toxin-antitoxin system YafQ family toxin [Pasteurella atlantic
MTKDFQRDFKKLGAKKCLTPEFIEVMYLLQHSYPLPVEYRDHALSGNMDGFRDCHIFNDLVLIYKIDDDYLYLSRIGTHSQVFK